MTADRPIPPGVDTSKPSIARVYDFMVGGKDNFPIDRMAAQKALEIMPDAREAGRACRAFLRRVVRHLAAEEGIRQFHGRSLVTDDTTELLEADIRDPKALLDRVRLDFTQPVGLLLFSVLHHVNDDEHPDQIAATLRDALPPGSFLALIHFWDPAGEHPAVSAKVKDAERLFNETLGTGRWRNRAEISAFFGDFEPVDPGLVPLAEWRPDAEAPAEQKDTYYTVLGGVARKP